MADRMTDPTAALTPGQVGRLERSAIGWLTTVTPEGQPQSMPIWFLWDDGTIVFYGQKVAARNRNLRHNPRVSFHLDDDGTGDAILVLDGEARPDDTMPAPHDNGAYMAKYGDRIAGSWTPERFSELYPHPYRIIPRAVRSF